MSTTSPLPALPTPSHVQKDAMPLQSRVTPFGEIVASEARGTLMGNRGCLHDAHRTLSRRRWTTRAWLSCLLSFGERRRELMRPGYYTELFFLDEATALAAGQSAPWTMSRWGSGSWLPWR